MSSPRTDAQDLLFAYEEAALACFDPAAPAPIGERLRALMPARRAVARAMVRMADPSGGGIEVVEGRVHFARREP